MAARRQIRAVPTPSTEPTIEYQTHGCTVFRRASGPRHTRWLRVRICPTESDAQALAIELTLTDYLRQRLAAPSPPTKH
jgi:hypothetical protein